MKKLVTAILIIVCVCLILTSCNFHYEENGLDNFETSDSSLGICKGLIPDDFIELFPYTDGNYFFSTSEKTPFSGYCDKALIYLKFDDEYTNAKKYVFESLDLSPEPVAEYNGYYFYDNETPANLGNSHLSNSNFPLTCNRFAYNDNISTLVFIGFDVGVDLENEVIEVSDDWGAFLEEYYGEWYDFSQ